LVEDGAQLGAVTAIDDHFSVLLPLGLVGPPTESGGGAREGVDAG
jgi:hypothetical protein